MASSDYLVRIHSIKKKNSPGLCIRRVRYLAGHGEEIFGLTDSYLRGLAYVNERFSIKPEKRCVEWRWRLKHMTHRLS